MPDMNPPLSAAALGFAAASIAGPLGTSTADGSAGSSAGSTIAVPTDSAAAVFTNSTGTAADADAIDDDGLSGPAAMTARPALLTSPSIQGLTAGAKALAKQEQAAKEEKLNALACCGAAKQNLLLSDLRHHLIYLLLGLGGLGIGFMSLSGLIATTMHSNMVPYVVTVDKHGLVLNEGALPALDSKQDLPEGVVTSQICDFIRNVRLITKDSAIQHQAILKAYAFVKPNSDLAKELSAYYRGHNPFTLAQKQSVMVEIANVLQVGEHTVQIDWVETIQNADPLLQRDEPQERKLRALLTYSIEELAPQETEMILLNPLNIYLHTFIVTDVIA